MFLVGRYTKGLLFLCLVSVPAPVLGMRFLNPLNWGWSSKSEKPDKEEKLDLGAVSLEENKTDEKVSLVVDAPVVKESGITIKEEVSVPTDIKTNENYLAARALFESIIKKLSTNKVTTQEDPWMVSPENLAGRYLGNIVCPKELDSNLLDHAHSFFGKQKHAFIVGEGQQGADSFFKDYSHRFIFIMNTTMDELDKQEKMKDPYVCVGQVLDENYLKNWCALFFKGVYSVSEEPVLKKITSQCSDVLKNNNVYLFDGMYGDTSCLASMVIVNGETAYIAYCHDVQENCTDRISVEKAMLQRCCEYMHHKNKEIKRVVGLSRPNQQEKVFASLGLIKAQKFTQYFKK